MWASLFTIKRGTTPHWWIGEKIKTSAAGTCAHRPLFLTGKTWFILHEPIGPSEMLSVLIQCETFRSAAARFACSASEIRPPALWVRLRVKMRAWWSDAAHVYVLEWIGGDVKNKNNTQNITASTKTRACSRLRCSLRSVFFCFLGFYRLNDSEQLVQFISWYLSIQRRQQYISKQSFLYFCLYENQFQFLHLICKRVETGS